MKITQRFPAGPDTEVENLLAGLTATPEGGPLTVGDDRIVDFLVKFARKLLAPATARRFPELASLGFFLRRGEIGKALATGATRDGVLRFPRGLAFHVPPANVDTIFVYSWALSALAGNRNVVRISPRSAGAASAVIDALNEALAEAHPAVAQTQRMVTYDRDDAVTAALSAACDLRVIWGGDRAVTEVRRHPLAPHARDLTFPDRASFAALSVAGWDAATADQRRDAAIGFYNDSYWFDQAACASPRTLFWVGDAERAVSARTEFRALLSQVIADKQHVVEPAMAVQKRVSTYGVAADGLATDLRFDGNAVATLELVDPGAVPREWLGAGTFPMATVASLDELAAVIGRKDQTLSCFGFNQATLVELANTLAGRGIDRIVPFGSALTFSAVWDGYDLLAEFSRLVTVTV
ncbi:Coenzyme F390 synthetase [Alloactinosynnema sp. L-07]|uniref:acyl-CoA reductase n=1 Tax=Alloactinosynnema sp. L-07 TaxID=1653480 RepID=UPI00065F0144|nr:acyl-CoA reductase [Alloactinosynnema sp. L-07]CRK60889.1 Coenzyme F390 synthetase [Alloactinosynnema sp. L-07]